MKFQLGTIIMKEALNKDSNTKEKGHRYRIYFNRRIVC